MNISINIPKLIFRGYKMTKSVKIVINFKYNLEFRENEWVIKEKTLSLIDL